ncbi:hypothetical protein HPB48_016755 [Haemaphysalis longicornis]|uniref:Uncharacterized protein n=1 Tax=Haemaphysalis longicornis TaxID=44386 RepID=A0A9J6G8R3_HAELO|nr:hypothetical protein HPB48_016755 [Haemaphysalis longicornis]
MSDVFRGKKTWAYHEEMDGPHFESWFDGVLQKLPSGRVIMWTTPPTAPSGKRQGQRTNSLKGTITEWLDSKDIQHGARLTKKQLLKIVA